MIELAKHIEILLLENDCVIIPGFGGFIAHYNPAIWLDEESILIPPARTIGFNPQLKMNDGILAQSFMETYHINFPNATKILQKKTEELIEILHKEGRIDLINIGEISLSVHDSYVFSPYNDQIISSKLYALNSFEIKELRKLEYCTEKKISTPASIDLKKNYIIRINRTFLRSTAAAIAAIAVFFCLSSPIANTYVEKENYARILPSELFNRVEQYSLLTTPIKNTANNPVNKIVAKRFIKTTPIAVKEIKVPEPAEIQTIPEDVPEQKNTSTYKYHLIVASVVNIKSAEPIVDEYRSKGYADACTVIGDGRIRISLMSYSTHEEAYKQLQVLHKNEAYKNAWLLAK